MIDECILRRKRRKINITLDNINQYESHLLSASKTVSFHIHLRFSLILVKIQYNGKLRVMVILDCAMGKKNLKKYR